MRSAFSLVESLVALTILAVALLSMALLPVATTTLLAASAQRERASPLALSLLEKAEGVEPDSLRSVSFDFPEGFTGSLSVEEESFSVALTAVVSWRNPTGGERSVNYRRQVSRHGTSP